VNVVQKTVFRVNNRLHAAVYRASKGRLGAKAVNGSPVALLTVAGRKTGTPRTVPVAAFPLGDGWVVVGSAGGDAAEAQWFRNLRATDHAGVQVGDVRHDVSVRLLEGVERDVAFAGVVAAAPGFGTYEGKSGRRMPVALLTPR
jgi:deazaflavin-dependent oxidoreductase (nitroreductase family)